MDKNQTLAKAGKDLMFKEPYYGLFLMKLNKVWSNALQTAGVSKNGVNFQLSINEDFWGSLTEDHRKGILKHEILHIAFFHLTMRDSYPNHRLFNIAADIEINQYIDESWLPAADMTTHDFKQTYGPIEEQIKKDFEDGTITGEEAQKQFYDKIPTRGVFLKDFPELKMEEKKGTNYYYKMLQESHNKGESPLLDQMLGQMGGQGDNPGQHPSTHPSWKEFDNMSEAEKKIIQKQTDYALKEVADQVTKNRGTVPGELSDYIKTIDKKEPPKFDWKGYLRMFTGGSIKTYTKKTRRKNSRRFKGNPGLRVKQRKHILVGVDTSGSVNKKELMEFFHEIYHMSKTGCDITVVQCDTAISNISKYKKGDEMKIHGRGGTSFQPVVDYFNEHQRHFSCLVYLTDGEAPAPEPRPKGRTLWVLSSESNMNDKLPGAVIKLN